MKSVLLIIGAVIIIILSPATLSAINDFRQAGYSENHVITTGGGITAADITLSQDLFGGYTALVSLSSNVTADAAIPSTFTEATNLLHITGLQAANTRMLTVDYKIDGLVEYAGAGIVSSVWPIFLILGVIGIIAGAVYVATRHGE